MRGRGGGLPHEGTRRVVFSVKAWYNVIVTTTKRKRARHTNHTGHLQLKHGICHSDRERAHNRTHSVRQAQGLNKLFARGGVKSPRVGRGPGAPAGRTRSRGVRVPGLTLAEETMRKIKSRRLEHHFLGGRGLRDISRVERTLVRLLVGNFAHSKRSPI